MNKNSSLETVNNLEYARNFAIQEIQQIYEDLGHKVPTKKEFLAYSETKYRYLGLFNQSYNNLIKAAGLRINRDTPSKPQNNKISREDLVKDLRRVHEENPSLSISRIIRLSGHSTNMVSRLIGGIKDVAAAIGILDAEDKNTRLPYRDTSKKSEDVMLKELQEAAIAHPEAKTITELIQKYCSSSVSTFYRHFGKVETTLKEFVKNVKDNNKQHQMMAKRYPVKYKAAPIILRWNTKRGMRQRIS